MQKAVDYLAGHPVLFFIAVIVSLLILFSFLKRVMRLLLVVAAVLVLYAAWLHFTGGNMHEPFLHIEQWFNALLHFFVNLFRLLFDLVKSPKKGIMPPAAITLLSGSFQP